VGSNPFGSTSLSKAERIPNGNASGFIQFFGRL